MAENKIGRKTKYGEWLTEEGLKRIESWARDGLSNVQIAKNMNIEERTLYTWIKRFNQLDQALKRGKAPADFEVENALYKSALGYEYTETKTIIETTASGKKIERVERVKKHTQPNVGAIIFWLKNRKPDVWKDKREITTNEDSLNRLDDLLEKLDGSIDE